MRCVSITALLLRDGAGVSERRGFIQDGGEDYVNHLGERVLDQHHQQLCKRRQLFEPFEQLFEPFEHLFELTTSSSS
jgi:hypothetical protein